jgi:hypothetical protein
MALGDQSNYTERSKVFDPNCYSRMRIKNRQGYRVDFSYGSGLLRITVSKETQNYRYDEVGRINLSATKAKMLIVLLEDFINKMKNGEPIDPKAAVGVNSGVGDTVNFIGFKVTGNKPEIPEHSFIIGKVTQTGVVESTSEFVFETDYDYALQWSNIESMDVERQYFQFQGITNILDVLKEFAASSGGAIGASVWDTGRYEMNRLSKKIDPILDKLGIERRKESDNFFTRQGVAMNPPLPPKSSTKSFNDIEGMVGGDDPTYGLED